MELGEKIRQARLELGLSQRQLCAEKITRNMLSQIENGAARPSMDTLAFLAQRLGKSVSYFLEEQAVVSPNITVMEQAKQAFSRHAYRKALDILEGYRQPDALFDQEQQFLLFLCCLEEGHFALLDGRIPYAREILNRASAICCPYITEPLQLQLRLLRQEAGLPKADALSWDALLYARAESEADPARAKEILLACEDRISSRWNLAMAEAFFALGDYSDAKEHYLLAEEAFPEIAMAKLEQCFRELGDFKRAYEYACKQR